MSSRAPRRTVRRRSPRSRSERRHLSARAALRRRQTFTRVHLHTSDLDCVWTDDPDVIRIRRPYSGRRLTEPVWFCLTHDRYEKHHENLSLGRFSNSDAMVPRYQHGCVPLPEVDPVLEAQTIREGVDEWLEFRERDALAEEDACDEDVAELDPAALLTCSQGSGVDISFAKSHHWCY